jgi:TolA-binding protein
MRFRPYTIALIALGWLTAAAGNGQAGPADDDRFLAGLRQRRLYGLAESFCRQQLRRSGLSDQRRAELAIELTQTCADHASQASGHERDQLCQQALIAARDFIRQEPTSPRLVLVQVQLAIAQTRQARALLDDHELGAAIALEPIREMLREAIGQLQAAGRDVAEQLRRKRQGEVNGPGMLTAAELGSLDRHVQFELAGAMLAQARSYPAGSPDRVSAATQADELLTSLAGRDEADALVWSSRLGRIAAARLSGDAAGARSREQSLEVAQPPPEVYFQAWAELIDVELDAGHVEAALKMVQSHASDKPRSPEWHYAVLATYVAAWRQAAEEEKANAAQSWQTKAAKEAELIEQDYGLPWSRQANMLLASAAVRSLGTGETAVQIKAAETFFRAGRTDEALAAYDQARQQAANDGQPQAAFDAGFTAAAIEHEQKHYAKASRRFRALALEFPKLDKAPEAHLLAAYDMAQLADASRPQSIDAYAASLNEQIKQWPTAPSTDTARLWLGKLYESQHKLQAALDAYRAISATSPQYSGAIESMARCWSSWLEGRQAAGDSLAKQALAAGESFYALAAPGGRWPSQWNATQRAAALAAAKIWLQVTDDRFERAEALLRAIPAAEGDDNWLQQSLPLLVLALAGQGRHIQASDLIPKLPPAAGDISSWQIAADGLDRLAESAADPAKRELGELALALCDKIVQRTGGLSDAQQQSVALLRARALTAAGRGEDARQYLASLVHDFPRNQQIRLQYASALSDAPDPAGLHAALDTWRALEQSSRSGSETWFRAKYGLALTHFRLGNHDRAARIIELTQVLHPELGGEPLKKQFAELLARCRQPAPSGK